MDGPVFISYAKEDINRIELLVNFLTEKSIPVWWDDDLEGGQRFRNVIGDMIDKAACVVVAWSVSSVNSDWVRSEAGKGNKRGLLIPIKLDKNINVPLPFGEFHQYDLTGEDFLNGRGMKKLLKALESVIKHGRPVNVYDGTLLDNKWTLEQAINATEGVRVLVAKLSSIREVMVFDAKPIEDIQLALKEVEKTYKVVSEAIKEFLAPLATPGKLKPKSYLEMERGSLLSLIKRGHGHCTIILTHYAKVKGLREWITPRLNAKQMEELDNVFAKLGTADGDLFREMTEIAQALTNESRIILNLLLSDQKEVAKKRIIECRNALQPLEEKLITAYMELQEIQQLIGIKT